MALNLVDDAAAMDDAFERESEMPIHRALEEKRRDWVSLLVPSLLAVVFSLAIQAVGVAWYFGGLNNRVTSVEEHQKLIDATRVTQEDLKSRDATLTIEKQELDIRLNRMDDKLDRLMELEVQRGKHE